MNKLATFKFTIRDYGHPSDVASLMQKARKLKQAGKTSSAKSYSQAARLMAKQIDKHKRGLKDANS